MNWKYAIGEVALIVVGVTIAFAANSWYEGRKDYRDERLVLQQMRQTLTEDLEDLGRRSATMHLAERDVTALLNHLERKKPYTEDIGRYIGSLTRFRGVRIRLAPFEALKARGLDLLANESLRIKLISFYKDDFARLEFSTTNNRIFIQDTILPYLMANVHQLESRGWEPYDYEKITSDGYLANLCRNRLFGLRDYVLPYFENTIASIHEILGEIEKELDD